MTEDISKPSMTKKKKALIASAILAVSATILGFFFPEQTESYLPVIEKVVSVLLGFL